MNITRRLTVALAVILGTGPALAADPPRPNVILILADDLGLAEDPDH